MLLLILPNDRNNHCPPVRSVTVGKARLVDYQSLVDFINTNSNKDAQ